GETTILVRYLHLQTAVGLAFIPQRPGFVWTPPQPANFIDEHVFARLKKLRMNPSELSTDTIFLRRAYLDVIGLPPTAGEVRRFLDDKQPGKRAKAIDELLARPEYADKWAQMWSDLLRNEEKQL